MAVTAAEIRSSRICLIAAPALTLISGALYAGFAHSALYDEPGRLHPRWLLALVAVNAAGFALKGQLASRSVFKFSTTLRRAGRRAPSSSFYASPRAPAITSVAVASSASSP